MGVRLAACALSVTLATVFIGLAPENNLIWVANGVLLAFLLLAPRRNWPAYLGIGFVAQLAGSTLVDPHWQMNLFFTALNLAEIFISASLLRWGSTKLPRFTDRTYLLRFIAFAVLAGPAVIGLVYAAAAGLWLHSPPEAGFFKWTASDSLGAAVATPACVAILRMRLNKSIQFRWNWIYLLVVGGVAVATFCQTEVPIVFVLYPLLILVLLRLGLGWAAMSTLVVSAVGSWFTMRGQGPFAPDVSLTPMEPSILLQLFLACAMIMLYSVSLVLESRRTIERKLEKIASLHTLVAENSRDIILLTDFNGLPRYISPAVHSLTGWRPDETMERGFADVAHPEDLSKIESLIRDLREGSETGTIEYRVKKRSGGYVWVEGCFRIIRDRGTGERSAILQTVRDITERKVAERAVKDAYKALEALAATDPLTGLANRRTFDQALNREWRRGLRERHPLSLLMIDADLFKMYNDEYGHPRGDSCLKLIAETVRNVVSRPGDLVARLGGEEFVVILPDTDSKGAMQLSEQICEALRGRRIPHKRSPIAIVTVSVGCATLVPVIGQQGINLIELADKALYEAKRGGRNQVCDAGAAKDDPAPSKGDGITPSLGVGSAYTAPQ
ncbi:MAG: diguanylate cyclase [Terracidiphilus sp.]|jgi:diguanylate cyclase (GGDEF)-like protein/PAS domain S-box-containing protein